MLESPDVRCVVADTSILGETPCWSAREQALYWINCEEPPLLHRFDPSSGINRSWPMPQRIGAVATIDGVEQVLVALAKGIHVFDPATAALRLVAENPTAERALHEGKVDRQGRFWIGSLDVGFLQTGNSTGAVFHRLDGDRLDIVIRDIELVTNGLAWSPDGTRMYFVDSTAHRIFVADYDVATGTPSGRRLFATVDERDGIADGASVDVDGGYWVALYCGGRLRRYRPDGTIDREVRMPVLRPTMVGFGGPDDRTAYVTTARHGMSEGDKIAEPRTGSLFALDLGVRGCPEVPVKGVPGL